MSTTIQESAAPARAIQPAASVPVSGLVDSADGHALVRVSGYRPSPADVYVSAGQLKQYGLRQGDRIDGTARPSGGVGRSWPADGCSVTSGVGRQALVGDRSMYTGSSRGAVGPAVMDDARRGGTVVLLGQPWATSCCDAGLRRFGQYGETLGYSAEYPRA